ncbi:MAG: hypothetical protein ACO3DQ_02650, partial [Cephaloticoccus sp.]
MVTEPTPVSADIAAKPAVLVVDDEYGPRESIAFTLSSEFAVETASRAVEADRPQVFEPPRELVWDVV